MVSNGPYRELSPEIGENLFQADIVAELLGCEGVKEVADSLSVAARVIEGNYVTGMEQYVRPFQKMGFLSQSQVRKNISKPLIARSVRLANDYLGEHTRIMRDAYEDIEVLAQTYPDVLYGGNGHHTREPISLRKVVGFDMFSYRGDALTLLRPTYTGEASRGRKRTAICNIGGLSPEIQQSLRTSLLELS